MIQALSVKYKKPAAYFLLMVFYLQFIVPLYAAANSSVNWRYSVVEPTSRMNFPLYGQKKWNPSTKSSSTAGVDNFNTNKPSTSLRVEKPFMGGPSSPEAASFKAVGSNNLVNLFTGDFSYSIPLLDVGGYPVNLFYSAGIGMEQEASWVGLGWNINPGTVSRNMRGIPDDFDGTDFLTQTQKVKPNRTWGGEVAVDGEVLGIKQPKLSFSLGYSYNNYLGPEVTTGASVSVSLPIMQSLKGEKAAEGGADTAGTGGGSLGIGIGAKLSSRSGLTLSPSLNASLPLLSKGIQLGVGLSTSYNSRSGISSLNLNAEASLSRINQMMKATDKNEETRNVINEAISTSSKGARFMGLGVGSTSITFAKPSYVPSLRMPMQNSYTSGQVELGAGAFGLRGAATLNGFYTQSEVPTEMEIVKKPLVGYMYSEKATSNVNAVMDFNRVNDAEVTPNTPVISAPMYTYDIFSIQGEGTGGSIRAYRGDLGFMRDNETVSKDKSLAIGADFAPIGHYGVNVNKVSSPTRVGGWEDNNNTLRQTMSFQTKQYGGSFENVYFKNPSEGTVTNDKTLERIGYDNLVRFKVGGSGVSPRIESQLESFGKKTSISNGALYSVLGKSKLAEREKRTQVITMLNAEDAGKIGLDPFIKTYKTGTNLFDASDNHLLYDSFPRINGYHKKNHISEIDVLEQSGMRYVYGIPVYNKIQKDFTFSVGALQDANNLVSYNENDTKPQSEYMSSSSRIDGYLEVKETPAYASSFLLSGLLSPDYVDVTGNGITEDDLGGAVKFNYTESEGFHKWRTPRNNSIPATAHFNEGKRTEMRDNKATITYGEREEWYLNSIESKSMIAVFTTTPRDDAKGVNGDMNGVKDITENANLKLSKIDLYTKADVRANGIKNAKPVKSVYFEYNYALCKGTPDNNNGQGKLTLTAISFGYNGQPRTNKERYVFNYGNTGSQKDNPDYGYNASDRWGTYKPAKDSVQKSVNPGDLNNLDYPFTINAQDDKNKTEQATAKQINDQFAAAWSLRKILLPSGGQMEMQYEADDYGYVQDRRACNMYSIYGLGKDINASTNNTLYSSGSNDNLYVYVKLPQPLQSTDPVKRKDEIYAKYLQTLNQLLFKLQIIMPKGAEPLTLYATGYNDYGLCANSPNNDIIYLKLSQLDGKSPLTKTAIGFLVNNLTGQAFPGYDASETNSLGDFLNLAGEMFGKVTEAFKNTETQMRDAGNAREIILARSFVRLANPTIIKYGGGLRVKQVLVRDNWDRMTKQYASTYGQDYDYTTIQKINGVETTVSSGVASYEPGIGSEENPFREIITYKDQLPLASAMYGAIEMPILETMYPSPLVGYSKVTVRSIHRKGTHGDSTLRSAIGKQVTGFYTAKEYPSYSAYTDMNIMTYHKKPFFSFFSKEIVDRKIVSQGFLVENNDMHGKMKSQIAYSESDEKTPLSYSYHTYKNTGKNGLNDKVDFVFNKESGVVRPGTMGVDMELMTDVREFSLMSNGTNTMGQVDIYFIAAFTVPILAIYPSKTYIENKYRAVTCTKLINYHAIEDTLIVMDKGSVVKTRTIAYDAETGTPLVTQTENEFNDPVYTVSYPAHWAYSGAGPAYSNIGTEFKGVSFIDGRITSSIDMSLFESGDELYIIGPPSDGAVTCPTPSGSVSKLWAFDKNKNNTALTVPAKDLIFIDADGNPYTNGIVNFRIVRSGHRNNLPLTVSSATSMSNPIREVIAGQRNLVVDAVSKVVSASAISFKEKWQTDIGVINNRVYYKDGCADKDSIACEGGVLEKKINPYLKGLVGNLKPYRSYTYYGSRVETNSITTTNIRKNGYINGFGNYWLFNASNNLIPNDANTNWVWNSELTKVNAKGQELETKDALNRYTAAQYGYAKNLPVAMSQNARLGESFYEGFEDYDYLEALNKNAPANCNNNRYINLAGVSGSGIAPSIGHTGKYVMQVAGGQAVKALPLVQAPLDNFNFNWTTETTKVLADQGGSYETPITVSPNFAGASNTPENNLSFLSLRGVFSNGGFNSGTISLQNSVSPSFPGNVWSHTLNYSTSYYVEASSNNNYGFTMYANPSSREWNNGSFPVMETISIAVAIYDLDNNMVFNAYYSPGLADYNGKTINAYLCKGIYSVRISMADDFRATSQTAPSNTVLSTTVMFELRSNTSGLKNYKTLNTQNGCTYTRPLASTNDMLNQRFALVPGKRMQFCAWVKEKCDSMVCYKPSYVNNHVELQFPGTSTTVTLKPSGNIIEGWQKIEGEFTVPANATSANLVFSNDGTQPIYFDDIRIHPYNANMKGYVYDNRTQRLTSELDENNYASFYEYDEEGQLIRVKKETIQGIKTIKETRSAKQRSITDF